MLSTSRLKEIYKREQGHRKALCVMNDLERTKQNLYVSFLDREKKETAQKCQTSIINTRRNIARQRVLKECMKTTKLSTDESSGAFADKYGQYKGVCVEQIAKNAETFLEKEHPRIRRQRRLNQLFEKGYEKGDILDPATTKKRVNDYFERPLVQLQNETGGKTNRKERATYLPPLASGFYSSDVADELARLDASLKDKPIERNADYPGPGLTHRKVSKYLADDVPDNLSVQSEQVETPWSYKLTSNLRPVTLPPIKMGTDNSTTDGKPKTNCVADLISRLNRAKDKRDREGKVRMEKRAKRLQAERVHGYQHAPNDTHKVTGHSLIVEGYGQNYEPDEYGENHPSEGDLEITEIEGRGQKYVPGEFRHFSKQDSDEGTLPPLKFKSSAFPKV